MMNYIWTPPVRTPLTKKVNYPKKLRRKKANVLEPKENQLRSRPKMKKTELKRKSHLQTAKLTDLEGHLRTAKLTCSKCADNSSKSLRYSQTIAAPHCTTLSRVQ